MGTTKNSIWGLGLITLSVAAGIMLAGCNASEGPAASASGLPGGNVSMTDAGQTVSERFALTGSEIGDEEAGIVKDDFGNIQAVTLSYQDPDFDSLEVKVNGEATVFALVEDSNGEMRIELPASEESDTVLEVNYCREKKVTICHIPPGNHANRHTIEVGSMAVKAHLAHGDKLGACDAATPAPTAQPTAVPTAAPTAVPTAAPTPVATVVPEPTAVPTAEPTAEPTPVATIAPEPTAVPTAEPTAEPTPAPTVEPTPVATAEPTAEPTAVPTPVPTVEPTPTPVPTPNPSVPFVVTGFDAASGRTSVYLIWFTMGVPSTSQVFWGNSEQLGNASAVNTNLVTDHSMTIGGLLPNMTYYFQAASTDAFGRTVYSTVIIKTTKP